MNRREVIVGVGAIVLAAPRNVSQDYFVLRPATFGS